MQTNAGAAAPLIRNAAEPYGEHEGNKNRTDCGLTSLLTRGAFALTMPFRTFADERRRAVTQLQEAVSSLGGEPTDDGSLTAGVHRRWLDLRDALLGGDEAIILETERCEDHLKAEYDEALADSGLSSGTQGVIREAYQSVVAGYNQARQLKQSLQDTPA